MLPSKINPHFDLHRTLDGHPFPTTGTCTGPKLLDTTVAAMYTLSREQKRWTGKIEDVADAIRLTATELAKWGDDWQASSEVDVVFRGGLTRSLDSVEELVQLHASEVADITKVRATVDVYGPSISYVSEGPRVTISLGAFDAGIRVETSGQDRSRVEGVTSNILRTLNRSMTLNRELRQLTRWGILVTAFVVAFVWVMAGSVLSSFGGISREMASSWQAWLITWGPVMLIFVTGALLMWTLPRFELLVDGRPSRFRRLRGLILTSAGSLVLAIVASVIWLAISSAFGD